MKLFCLFLSLLLSGISFAEQKFSPLSEIDKQFLSQQFESINDIAKLELGTELRQNRSDLETLQKIIDRKLVDKKDALKQQAMGTVMGELLKKELNLDWVILEDQYGRTRALRLGNTEHLLFPNTMISRRIKVDLPVDVKDIYQRNYNYIYQQKSNPGEMRKIPL